MFVRQQLDHFNSNVPDFNNYLTYIFVTMKNCDPELRQAAGLILKNNLRKYYKTIPSPAMEHIKQLIVQALADPVMYLRSTAGNVITSLVYYLGLHQWPDLLRQLVFLLDSKDIFAVQGAMDALYKICEDIPDQLNNEEVGRPLNYLIPKLITFFQHPDDLIRSSALAAVLNFLPSHDMPNALVVNMDGFLKGLFVLANDQNLKVKKYVCRAFVMLLEDPKYLKPHFKNVVEYMLICTNDDTDDELALEACEFWSVLAESEECQEFLTPLQHYLPKLLPILLKCMVYSQMDRVMLEEESNRPDKDSDIAPSNFFVRPKTHDFRDANATTSLLETTAISTIDDDEDLDDEEDDDFDEIDQEGHEWNLRKCAASSLDIFSNVYKSHILPVLLPHIQDRMQPNQPWEVRESAILALGAIAEGCRDGMQEHLQGLIPYLIRVLDDQKPLVRSITCWTVSRYASWIIRQNLETVFQPVLIAFLQKLLDTNKRVQEAACSAFATLEEVAGSLLVPYLGPILDTISKAFNIYQKRNVFILYDAIRTLTDSVGDSLNNQEFINVLMPPLIQKWNQLDDNDKNLFPLLECLTGVAGALKSGFLQFAQPVFKRCLTLIEKTFAAVEHARVHNLESPDKDFIVCSLDLLSGIIEGLGPNVESLVSESNLLALLYQCMQDSMADVRQSAFGVVGDLSKTCIGHMRTILGDYIRVLIFHLNPNYPSVCNNAAWALGEIAVQIGADMKVFVPEIMVNILPILLSPDNHNLLENMAITIGRLGLVSPDITSANIDKFSKNWCLALRKIRNDTEKEHAYRGLCAMIKRNPQGVLDTFAFVCDAITSYQNPPQELKQEFTAIFRGFKQSMPEQSWNQFLNGLPPKLLYDMRNEYQV
jgi:transportin-1